MKLLSKLSGVQAIGSENNSFAQARILLSIQYTIVFGTLILLLSGILYYLFAADIYEDMSSVFPDKSEQVRIINQHKGKLLKLMLIIDGSLLMFIAAASYYLAGKTLKPIQENYEAQKRFIADASHDLRTPIAILKADLEVYIQDKKFTPSLKPIFKSYLEEVDQMKQIVEDLLMLFRFDSNQMVIEMKTVDFKKILTNSTAKMSSYAKCKNVNLQLYTDSEMLVSGDALLLQQAYRNILKNAIEYSYAGGDVIINVTNVGRKVKVEVRNGGIGIPKANITHVFERFFRTDGSKEKRREGTGLGLPIAKQIVEKHAGSIFLTSSPQNGTTVSLMIPRIIM
ncbi:MAG: HAMP domain-containing sensor histidine kinase [Patescibacteria group bacterium]